MATIETVTQPIEAAPEQEEREDDMSEVDEILNPKRLKYVFKHAKKYPFVPLSRDVADEPPEMLHKIADDKTNTVETNLGNKAVLQCSNYTGLSLKKEDGTVLVPQFTKGITTKVCLMLQTVSSCLDDYDRAELIHKINRWADETKWASVCFTGGEPAEESEEEEEGSDDEEYEKENLSVSVLIKVLLRDEHQYDVLGEYDYDTVAHLFPVNVSDSDSPFECFETEMVICEEPFEEYKQGTPIAIDLRPFF